MADAALLRAVVIALLAAGIGGKTALSLLYLRARRRTGRPAGPAPLHVALVAVQLVAYEVLLAWGQMEGLRDDRPLGDLAVVRLVAFGVVCALGLTAMWVLTGGTRRRRPRWPAGAPRPHGPGARRRGPHRSPHPPSQL